ncbi:hypothetical protein JKP88DRAFT_336732 [Tribonema minus]|uniref:MYND-type domain-containing protein n=1 Tax=Tribonema minus TaxID=303371 RepID=A0A835YK69_9STRA|nr:hypothetical protein JKP88DRAFT_336732 [Tribonema minus]
MPGADPIECLERVELAPDAQLGTVLRATRALAAGEVVLRERPLVVYAGYTDLMRQVKRMPAKQIAELLGLLRDETMRAPLALEEARSVALPAVREAGGGIDMGVATKLVLLGSSHGFSMPDSPARGGKLVYDLSCMPDENQCRRGFMRLAGATALSCAPNCMRSACATLGYTTLIATRAIAAGEAITRSIVRLTDSTQVRRAELLTRQGHACACARCIAPDVGFGLPCFVECCRGTLAPLLPAVAACLNPDGHTYANKGAGEVTAWTWHCTRCALRLPGGAMLARLSPVTPLSQRLDALYAALSLNATQPCYAAPLAALLADTRRQLCATHIIALSALNLLATLYAAAAARFDDVAAARLADDDGRVITSRARVNALAAKTEMDALRVLECTPAGCDRGAECNAKHPIVAEPGIAHAVNAFKSLQYTSAAAAAEAPGAITTAAAAAAIAAARCPRLVPHLRRYAPVVAGFYGVHSDDAVDMAAALGMHLSRGDSPLCCANCAVAAPRGAAAAAAAVAAAAAAAAELKLCGGCRCVRYCGAACQRAHYARHHKHVCKRLAAVRAGCAAAVEFAARKGARGRGLSG